jgi:hypothetical protein
MPLKEAILQRIYSFVDKSEALFLLFFQSKHIQVATVIRKLELFITYFSLLISMFYFVH